MNDFRDFLDRSLEELEEKGLLRQLKEVSGFQDSKVVIDGKRYLNLCSNNYLGLANDSRLGNAAVEAIKKYGLGSGASRLVCGNMRAHEELEKTIARFKGAEDCLLFSSGYMANVGIISSLFSREDIIFSDKLNHASIIDGIRLSQAEFKRYAHADMAALEEMLKTSTGFKKRVIITDSVFSMDGDIAPLDKIVELAEKYDAWVMVDEAHALGVMGQKGRGLVEHFGLHGRVHVQMGTLSKAAGVYGAYCCGSRELIDFLINKARSFIYTTAIPASVAAAAQKAVEIIEEEPQLIHNLWDNTNYVRASLKLMGFNTLNSRTPIIPIVVGDSQLAVEFAQKLWDEGIFISAIRPPTVPEGTARLRLTVMAKHEKSELDYALNKLEVIGKELNII